MDSELVEGSAASRISRRRPLCSNTTVLSEHSGEVNTLLATSTRNAAFGAGRYRQTSIPLRVQGDVISQAMCRSHGYLGVPIPSRT